MTDPTPHQAPKTIIELEADLAALHKRRQFARATPSSGLPDYGVEIVAKHEEILKAFKDRLAGLIGCPSEQVSVRLDEEVKKKAEYEARYKDTEPLAAVPLETPPADVPPDTGGEGATEPATAETGPEPADADPTAPGSPANPATAREPSAKHGKRSGK